MRVEGACLLQNFRDFMILSTCRSFIPRGFLEDESIFPERAAEPGRMYVEAEDKVSVGRAGEISFLRASDVIGAVYTSKSGRTRIRWNCVKDHFGKVSGEASGNSLVNLYTARVLEAIRA